MKFLILIALLCCSLVLHAQQRSGEPSLRVMTFNIRYDEPRDGVNAWSNRKAKVAGVIRFHKADLIGVQEALLSQLRDLESLLPDLAWCGRSEERRVGKECRSRETSARQNKSAGR